MSEERVEVIEVAKAEKKALRKKKFKRFLKIAGLCTGAAAVSGIVAYFVGRNDGVISCLGTDGIKIIRDDAAEIGIRNFKSELLDYASSGKLATMFEDNDTHEVEYLLYTVTKDKPEWWDNCDDLPLEKMAIKEV